MDKYEILEFLKNLFTFAVIVVVFVGCTKLLDSRCSSSKIEEPTFAYVDFSELDEIKNLAENRDKDYSEILDEIVDKIEEIKQRTINEYEIYMDGVREKEIDERAERQW